MFNFAYQVKRDGLSGHPDFLCYNDKAILVCKLTSGRKKTYAKF